MLKKIMIASFLLVFSTGAFALTDIEEDLKLPAGIADWNSKTSDKILKDPIIGKRLKKLLGKENYGSFLESFETINPIEKTGDMIFSSGCMIRACGHLESAIAIDLKNKTIHAGIFNEIEETKYFNEKDSETPEAIVKWAKRLENLKVGEDKRDENQSEAILIDQFIYSNREDMMARVDNFTVQLQNDPTAEGYLVISGGKKSRTKAEKEIKDYLKQRLADFNRFVFLNADGEKEALVELWLVPEGSKPPAPKKSGNQKESVETEIIALEKQAWEEWKNGNKKFVEGFVADDAFFVYADGVMNKSQIVEGVGNCDFNSYSLDDFKVKMLDKNSALVSYTAKQDIVCGGNPAPAVIRSTSVYVKKGGKWQNTFYTETEAASDNSSVESEIIALEKKGWEAWKNKDADFFRKFLTDDALSVNSGGVSDKAQILKSYGECDVKSYSLSEFKFRMLDKNSALLTFTGTQDAVCGGEKAPSSVYATSVYVKRGGKWLNTFYTETAAKQ